MKIPLEDGYADVIAKAQRGLGISNSTLADKTGLEIEEISAIKEDGKNPGALGKIALALGLNPEALTQLAAGNYAPEVSEPAGFAMFNSPFEDFTVNSYLVWDAKTREAIVFDTGADATELLHTIVSEGLTVHYILLTHTHGDHILELDRVIEKTGAPAFSPEKEPIDGAAVFVEGTKFKCGAVSVESFTTNGHSLGGTTFFVKGLSSQLAIVGDAIFAGSMGGAATSWELALKNNREKILSLPADTIICPGHGPLTTVAQEKKNNPFFSAAFPE